MLMRLLPGNLAVRVETEQKARRITRWEENLHNVEMFARQACESLL
jgi:hypothetical protein